jgi:hypothetical protein
MYSILEPLDAEGILVSAIQKSYNIILAWEEEESSFSSEEKGTGELSCVTHTHLWQPTPTSSLFSLLIYSKLWS